MCMGVKLSNVDARARGSDTDAVGSVRGNELYACRGRRLNSSGALGLVEAICELEA